MTKKTKDLSTDIVTTISGKKVDINKTCLIDKEYYEKDIDCVKINISKGVQRWYPVFSSEIGFNFLSKKWELIENLKKTDLKPFLSGFFNNDVNKKIFLWDSKNPLLNVKIRSHYDELSNNLKNFEKEIEKANQSLQLKLQSLNKEILFQNYYSKYLNFLAKLRYYIQIMEKSYDLENCTTKDIIKIIFEVDSFISTDVDTLQTFRNFEHCYKLYTDINLPVYEESVLPKITYEVSQNNQNLKKVFEIFIAYLGIEKSIKNEINNLETKISKLQKEIDIINQKGYFDLYCRTKEEAYFLGFIDSNISDVLYYKNNIDKDTLKILKQSYPVFSENVYKSIKINYNASSNADSFNKILNNYHSLKSKRIFTKDSYKLAKLLKGLSFGIEFETSCGRLREQDLSILGVVPLRDGSIKGFEYTTIPYGMKDSSLKETDLKTLSKDLISLKKLCKELSEKTQINNSCSMHLHIGGARKDKLFLIALYMLSYKIQDELFMLQPEFKKDAPKYLGSAKNYCQKLSDLNLFKNCIFDKSSILKENYCNNVDLHFNNIFKFLSGGYDIGSKYNRKNHVHPFQRKWERAARYHWINLVNCVFSDSGTIEFRLHSSTLNFTKVLNWLLICSAIVKYTETHIKEIVSNSIGDITLDKILLGYSNNFRDKKSINPYGLFIYNYLNSYVEERKNYFRIQTIKGDVLGEDDLFKDSKYSFNFNGIYDLI